MGANDHAAAALRSVYAVRPEHAGALAVSASILHCERTDHDEAERLCRRALAVDPGCLAAWDVLARGYAIQKRWHEAAIACQGAISHTPAGDRPRSYFVSTLAESHLRLGDWRGVAADVEWMRAAGGDWLPSADGCEVLASCWSEDWERALLKATRLLATGAHGWSDLLAAAKFESAHRLGRPDQAGGFNQASLCAMDANEFTKDWARRIRSHVASIPGPRA